MNEKRSGSCSIKHCTMSCIIKTEIATKFSQSPKQVPIQKPDGHSHRVPKLNDDESLDIKPHRYYRYGTLLVGQLPLAYAPP